MPRSKKSYEERITEKEDELQKALDKLNQIKEQKKALERRQREQERKARTHRLIVIGGIAEKILGRGFVDGDEKKFERFLAGQQSRGRYFSKAMDEQEPSGDEENVQQEPGQVGSGVRADE